MLTMAESDGDMLVKPVGAHQHALNMLASSQSVHCSVNTGDMFGDIVGVKMGVPCLMCHQPFFVNMKIARPNDQLCLTAASMVRPF